MPLLSSPTDSSTGLAARVHLFMAGAGGQFVRYAVTGFGVTSVAAAVYWLLATPFHVHPQLANLAGYACAVSLGYLLHSRWSFRGHGRRDGLRTTMRFAIASLLSLGMNSLWVWLLVARMGGPTWWPIVPILFVTPVATFWLNRLWVFE